MSKNFLFAAMVGAAALALVSAAPAFAGSVESDAFVRNVSENMTTLTQSSAMAADKSTNSAVQIFAKGELGTPDTLTVASADEPTTEARSVATEAVVDPAVYTAPEVGVTFPTSTWSITYLSSTEGKSFDWGYKAAQENALSALQNLYSAYSVTGSDPSLRAMAIDQLPKVVERLAALRSL